MKSRVRESSRHLFIALFVLMSFVASAEVARAGDQPTESQIIRALTPTAHTRGLDPGRPHDDAKSIETRHFIEGLRSRTARSLTVVEREKVAAIASERPHIDLEINFDYNSARVGPAAVPVLLALGRALSREEFKDVVFLLNGHTDAKGSAEYNQDLSERRAEAVKRLLIEQFGLPADTLVAVGHGKTQLKNAADPFAGDNRRVQVVNTEVK